MDIDSPFYPWYSLPLPSGPRTAPRAQGTAYALPLRDGPARESFDQQAEGAANDRVMGWIPAAGLPYYHAFDRQGGYTIQNTRPSKARRSSISCNTHVWLPCKCP
jgi:hypothetical protein